MFQDVAYLIKMTSTTNAAGDTVTTPTKRMVYVNEKGVRQSEFYQASAVGLRPELMLEMRRADYEGEKQVAYPDETSPVYDIIRTHAKNKDFIELVCQDTVNQKVSGAV